MKVPDDAEEITQKISLQKSHQIATFCNEKKENKGLFVEITI